jgi:hypothetical protein
MAGVSWRDMSDWCSETFGPVSDVWQADKWFTEPGARWYQNNAKFWFRDEADRIWFLLRWS